VGSEGRPAGEQRLLSLHFYRIKPGCEERLRAWLAELEARAEETRSIFTEGGARHEQAFILSTPEGAILVALAELDRQRAEGPCDARSARQLDLQHEEILNECLGEKLSIAPALDVVLSRS